MFIVLGCRDKKTLRMRTMKAAALASKQIGSLVLVTGNPKSTTLMVEMLAKTPICRRVKSEPNARTTAEMALLAASYIPESRRSDVTLVTSTLHAPRAKMLFEARLGVSCRVVAVERSGLKLEAEEERRREDKKIEHITVLKSIFQE